MLFLLYLKRIAIPLQFALLAAFLVCITASPTIMGSVILLNLALSYLASFSLAQQLFKKFAPQLSQKNKLILSVILSTLTGIASEIILLPHLFLFFNALPLAASLTFLSLTVFLITFELLIHIPKLHLGDHYSLTKLILHPHSSMRRLARMLKPGIESLKLTDSDRNELMTRQQEAIAELPPNAIIDDVALYRKHFALETQRVAEENRTKPLTALEKKMQPFNIKTQALDNTREEAGRLEADYLATLTVVQQTAYRAYRALTVDLSPPYAECPSSGESTNDTPLEQFVIVEKRFANNGACVPNKTYFWHNTTGFRPLFSMRDPYNREMEPTVPADRDSFIAPRDEEGKQADYYYHTYTTVSNHGLSLQLCEAIENFDAKLSLSATRQREPARINPSNNASTALPAYRNTPPASETSVVQQTIFANNSDSSLSDLNLSEEERQMIYGV